MKQPPIPMSFKGIEKCIPVASAITSTVSVETNRSILRRSVSQASRCFLPVLILLLVWKSKGRIKLTYTGETDNSTLLKRSIAASVENNPTDSDADHVEEYGRDFFRMIREKNLDGIVAKHRGSRYDKTVRWIKIKNPDRNYLRERT